MTVASIPLDRHAVIEASAGTGKTYTIENLVLRLLTETDARLENILLVTFTEKATGELRTRLRQTLERKAAEQSDIRDILYRALDNFDQAPIFTIHAFCQRLLQEYALEQGQDFRVALVSDADLLRPTLREVQRKLWRTQFGDRLRAVLDHALFCRDSAGQWNARVLEVAEKYHPRSDHQLRPVPVADWWRRLDEPGINWTGQLEAFTIAAVRRQLAEHKRQRGLQSFDDMIGTVEESLDEATNPEAGHLLNRLRERYHFGIVDEFQDTDPLQWRIFRRIFLEAGAARLFVVGDPKQAIFGFRGADLPTYLRAAEVMKVDFGAHAQPLLVNWRSTPELLEALNCVFQDGDWFPKESGIVYRDISPPKDEERQARVITDLTNRAALTSVDLRAWEQLKNAQKQYARFVAREIQRLLHGCGGRPALTLALKKAERPLEAADIGILIFKRSEADVITEALADLDIPYSIQRQTGFWDSDEVCQLETVLQCLAQPEERSSFRKALLTSFFRVRPVELVRSEDLPVSHPARQLYQKWLACADARQWSALFQSMLEETGLLLHGMNDDDAIHRLAGLRHLMSTLERIGHGENRDLLGLLDWIRDQRRRRDGGEATQPPVEARGARVRIMTIHASKGLEFPVVFLAGGFTGGRARADGVATYRDDQGRKVFDLCPDADAIGRTNAEQLSEHRRLLYVALTRAMFKLYVPMVHIGNRSRAWAGPAGTVLLPALKQACPDKLGPLVAETVIPPRLSDLGNATTPGEEDAPLDTRPALAYSGALFPQLDPRLDRRRIVVRSFSSMSRQHAALIGEGANYGDRVRIAHDEAAGGAETEDPLRGPVFGDIIHSVLEAIDFTEVGHCTQPSELLLEGSPARRLIDREVRANVANLRARGRDVLEDTARQQVAELVWRALHTPLHDAGGPLWQLAPSDRVQELEFTFPEQPGEPIPANVRWEEGFLTGYIDLVFRRADRYFLLDWKTNLLAGYSPDQLARCMDDLGYHRQYRLYLQALARWLERVHGNLGDPLRHFGGVYYLFVRGLNGQDESTGVFFHRPTPEDLDLAQAIAR